MCTLQWSEAICSESDCNFVIPVSRQRSCPDHPAATLKRSNDPMSTKCPVEFAHNFPNNCDSDNRRWIMGYIRQQKLPTINLHNHAIPRGTKMCSFVKKAIQQSASINPQLRANQIAQGKGLPFIPGAVDSASTHIGRVAQQIKKGRLMASGGSSWDISDFERIADDIDKKDDDVSAKSPQQREAIKKLCRPYLISAGIKGNVRYIFTMNSLMCKLLSTSEFVEADITFNESLEYLISSIWLLLMKQLWNGALSAVFEWINKEPMPMHLHLKRHLINVKQNILSSNLVKHYLV